MLSCLTSYAGRSRQTLSELLPKAKALLGQSAKKVAPKEYKLLERTPKTEIVNFAKDSWVVPEDANFYNIVRVGKNTDPSFNREIVSFYKDDKLIKRCTKGTGVNNQIKTYEHDYFLSNSDDINRSGAFAKKITTEEYIYPQAIQEMVNKNSEDLRYLGMGNWKTKSIEQQYVENFYDLRKDYKYSKKLITNKMVYNPADDSKISASVVDYPLTLGFEPKNAKKVLGVDIVKKDGIPHIVGSVQTPNVQFPTNDEFLAHRFLSGKEKQESLSRHFLHENGLKDINVKIATDKAKVGKNIAHFSPSQGEICWREVFPHMHPVNTAAHEAEHALQYSQIGRLGKGTTAYEKECLAKLGPLSKTGEKREAMKYNEASVNYPSASSPDFYVQHGKNYLEIKAYEAGDKAALAYAPAQKYLLGQFPNLPKDPTLF